MSEDVFGAELQPRWFQLGDDERLLWVGAPSRALLVFFDRDRWVVPSSLLLGGWVAWAVVGTLRSEIPGNAVVLLPFAVLALYLLVGRFVVGRWLRSRTRYALTTDRAIIARDRLAIQGGPGVEVRERQLAQLGLIEKKVAADGSGTIWFEPERIELTSRASWRAARDRTRVMRSHKRGLDGFQFFRIADAATVLDLIERSTRYYDGDPPTR